MKTNESIQEALKFAASARGSYIIGQALSIAVTELERVPEPFKEVSNIADMKYLIANLYPIFDSIKRLANGK